MTKFFFAILMAFAFNAHAQMSMSSNNGVIHSGTSAFAGSNNLRCDYAGPDARDPNCRTEQRTQRLIPQDPRPAQDSRPSQGSINTTNIQVSCWSSTRSTRTRCLGSYEEAVVRMTAQRICDKVQGAQSYSCFQTAMDEITDAIQGPLKTR